MFYTYFKSLQFNIVNGSLLLFLHKIVVVKNDLAGDFNARIRKEPIPE